jgi:dTDP-4-dehydrorhamnose 3,5-epimerase
VRSELLMIFTTTDIDGVVVITPERIPDDRGFFAKTWGQDEFESFGLNPHMVARNVSYNREKGTLRGMHFQQAPHQEAKLVAPLIGSIYDVVIDLRPESASYLKWVGKELHAETGEMIYIPEGCAHGFITLEPRIQVEYLISAFYAPHAAGGVRWDDPLFAINWPELPTVVSPRDRAWPDFEPRLVETRR